MFEKYRFSSSTFYCFSPAVMLATFVIEFLLAFVAVVRYRTTIFGRLTIVTLGSLATFQAVEYQICTAGAHQFWTLIGLIAITALPSLGLFLIGQITNNRSWAVVGTSVGLAYIVLFLIFPASVGPAVCSGNYVILGMQPLLGWSYGAYYFGLLLVGIWQAARHLRQKISTEIRETLVWLIVGYLSFMTPMGVVYFLTPESRDAVPSIMCGFALIFALILTFKVLPAYHGPGRLRG